MQINIQRIFVVRNNKDSFPRNSHVGKMTLQDGSFYGYLVRVKARSFRRAFINGTNGWDIFYILSDWCWIRTIQYHLDTMPNDTEMGETGGIEIASLSGEKTMLTLRRSVETPLGNEWQDQLFSINWMLASELNREERETVNLAVRDARRNGFGPHGEILSQEFPEVKEVQEVQEVHSDNND